MKSFLPYSKQFLDKSDIKSVVKTLKSNFITQGPEISNFEKNFSKFTDAKYSVACATGTAALHISCQAIDINKNSTVVTTPITFAASANCSQFLGAKILFADIDPKNFCMSPDSLEKILKKNKVDLVIIVHMSGHPADLLKFKSLKKKYGFKLIEDSCHALGGSYLNHKIGSCEFSDISTFSFHPVKPITTGEGGMITTNDKKVFEKLLLFRTHGIHKVKSNFINKSLAFDKKGEANIWYYEMSNLGHNYRITDIQAALGNSQLKKLKLFTNRRRKIAYTYNKLLKENKFITTPLENKKVKHAYHLYTILVDFKKLKKERNLVMKELLMKGVGSQVLYIPLHFQPYYKKKKIKKIVSLKNSEKYYSQCLSIPIFYGLKDSQIKYISKTINKIISIKQ